MTARSELVSTAYVIVPVHQYSDGTQTIAKDDDGIPGSWGNVFFYETPDGLGDYWIHDWPRYEKAEDEVFRALGLKGQLIPDGPQSHEDRSGAIIWWHGGEKSRELVPRRVCECGTCQRDADPLAVGFLSASDDRGNGFSMWIYTEDLFQLLQDELDPES